MSKNKNGQKKIINELKNQLFVQAERLGIREDYSPVFLEELKLDSVGKILTEFYMERANLEYELNMLGSHKKELLIKLERLNAYIRKGVGVQQKHALGYEKLIEKGMGDQAETRRALRRHTKGKKIQAAA